VDPTAALPEGLVGADRACLVTFFREFAIVRAGVGRKGSSGWAYERHEILREPTDEQLGAAVGRHQATVAVRRPFESEVRSNITRCDN
jgi:hypothetical protein